MIFGLWEGVFDRQISDNLKYNPSLRIVLPCGHQCICGDCIDYATIRHCPICRKPCTTYLKEANKPAYQVLEKGEIAKPVHFKHDSGTVFPVDCNFLESSEDYSESDW